MSVLAELIDFIRARKKYWLIPILIVSLLLGGLLIVTKGSVVAPFIYTLF
jgi:general stress protein CsbA